MFTLTLNPSTFDTCLIDKLVVLDTSLAVTCIASCSICSVPKTVYIAERDTCDLEHISAL